MYTWKQKLTVDAGADKLIRAAVNAYSNEKKSHPYHNYGDKISISDYWYNPIYRVSLRSEFDRREVSEKTVVWHRSEGAPGPRSVTSPDQVDPWSFELEKPLTYIKVEKAFRVPGSQYLTTCRTCSGGGKETCPSCGGKGRYRCGVCSGTGNNVCSACSGSGRKTEMRTVTEYELVYRDYQSGRNYSQGGSGLTPVRVPKQVQKPVQVSCSACGGFGKKTCQSCGGSGIIHCAKCHESGQITCRTCEGSGQLLHFYEIHQTLSDDFQIRKWRDSSVPGVRDLIQEASKGESMLSREAPSLGHHLVPEETTIDGALEELLSLHEGKVDGRVQRLVFQRADVVRVDAWVVRYTYEGKQYIGGIRDGRFIPETSPITEYAEGLVASADKKVKGLGAVGARKLLDAAEELDVKTNRQNISRLRQFIRRYINEIHDTGLQLTFWLLVLFATPLLINFYATYNPVAKYIAFVNSPQWWGYRILPICQGVVFVFAARVILKILEDRDHSRERLRTAGSFLAAGIGRYLLAALGFIIVFGVLNYFGLSLVTMPLVLLAAAVIALGLMLISAIIGLVVSLIALIIHIL